MSVVTLSTSTVSVRFDGGPDERTHILRSLDGWLETPDAKTDVDERASGDGAHDIAANRIFYSARTIVVGYRLIADNANDRDNLLDMQSRIRMLVHHEVTIRVTDGQMDGTCTGYVNGIEVGETQQNVNWQTLTGQITLVCARPEILSYEPHRYQLTKRDATQSGDGLCYGTGLATYWEGEPNNSVSVLVTDMLAGSSGLQYPMRYTYFNEVAYQNTATLVNDGSSRAYPVFECHGPFPRGVALDFPGDDLHLECSMPVQGAPLILDCRSRTATIGGVDCSYALTSRGFPVIEPHGSLVAILSTGSGGHVNITTHDTYM